MKIKMVKLVFFAAFIAVPLNSLAQIENLSELALFNRCYAHLTGQRLPLTHNLRNSVATGRLSAVDACMQVLDSGKLHSSSSGTSQEGKLISDTPQGRLVLQRMNDFHRTWFPTDNFQSALPDGFSYNKDTRFLYDQGESALHVSRTLFTSGVNYSDVVLGTSSLEALRTSGPIQNPSAPPSNPPSDYYSNKSIGLKIPLAGAVSPTSNTRVYLQTELVQFGDLIGLRPIRLNPNKINLTVFSSQQAPVDAFVPYTLPMKPHESLGGGVLGTKSYLMLNLGRADYLPMDGGARVPRRWARSMYNSFLCRDVPIIRRSDAEPFVQSSGPSFRQSSSCMQCHASMDRTANVARNVSYSSIPILTDNANMQLAVWPTTEPAEPGPVTSDNKFHLRPTQGALMYRSYDGTLINRSVGSIQDLGSAFSSNKDMYVCAAARYFNFFTGIEVNLNDIGDTSKPKMSPDALKYREIVINLGLELMTTQSLRTLIQKIISSDVYRRSSLE